MYKLLDVQRITLKKYTQEVHSRSTLGELRLYLVFNNKT